MKNTSTYTRDIHEMETWNWKLNNLSKLGVTLPNKKKHTHTSSPTSFPRQDLKTSIAIEFISFLQVNKWVQIVQDVTSVVTIWSYSPTSTSHFGLKQQFPQDKNLDAELHTTLISDADAQRAKKRGGGREGGGRMEHAAKKPSVCEHVSSSFPKLVLFSLPFPSRSSLKWQCCKNSQ